MLRSMSTPSRGARGSIAIKRRKFHFLVIFGETMLAFASFSVFGWFEGASVDLFRSNLYQRYSSGNGGSSAKKYLGSSVKISNKRRMENKVSLPTLRPKIDLRASMGPR